MLPESDTRKSKKPNHSTPVQSANNSGSERIEVPLNHPSPVRFFQAKDIERCAELIGSVFFKKRGLKSSKLEHDLETVYLKNPWYDEKNASLVHVDKGGEIDGFLGVIPMPFRHNDTQLAASIIASFCVENIHQSPRAGTRLLRHHFARDHQISFTDTANQTSLEFQRRLRMKLAPIHSLEWVKILRPVQHYAFLARKRLPRRFSLAPTAKAQVNSIKPYPCPDTISLKTCISKNVSTTEFAAALLGHLETLSLHPDWTPDSLKWQLELTAQRQKNGETQMALVANNDGAPIGGFIYQSPKGRQARVLQLFAQKGKYPQVTASLFEHAWQRGCASLTGSLDPSSAEGLYKYPEIRYRHRAALAGNFLDPETFRLVGSGEAFFGGLSGESWSPLTSEEYS